MDLKTAAERLLEIADVIDKQAADISYFVCSSCNHTVSLSDINTRRRKAASEHGIGEVSDVTVEDKISCPVGGCDGTLSYVPTDESERLYVEAADDEDIFEPVDEQEDKAKKKKEEELGIEPAPGEAGPKEPEEEPLEEPVKKDIEPEVKEEESEEEEPEEGAEEVEDVTEEEVTEEEPKKKTPKKKKKDKPDDEKAALPKEPKPKFEKMPKDAGDEAFARAVAKYASY